MIVWIRSIQAGSTLDVLFVSKDSSNSALSSSQFDSSAAQAVTVSKIGENKGDEDLDNVSIRLL